MKVTDTTPVVANTVSKAAERTSAPVEHAPVTPKDRVSVPKEPVRASAAERTARLQEITAAVKGGQYYPSPSQIAERIVSNAELEAHLRAMFDHG